MEVEEHKTLRARSQQQQQAEAERRNRIQYQALCSLEQSHLPPRMQQHQEKQRQLEEQGAQQRHENQPSGSGIRRRPLSAAATRPASATRTQQPGAVSCKPPFGASGANNATGNASAVSAADFAGRINSARVMTGWRPNSALEVKNNELTSSNAGLQGRIEQLTAELERVKREHVTMRRQLRGTPQAMPQPCVEAIDCAMADADADLQSEIAEVYDEPAEAQAWSVASWLHSLDVCGLLAQHLCKRLRRTSADPRMERAFVTALGGAYDTAAPPEMPLREVMMWLLREIPLVEELGERMAQGAHRLAAERAERAAAIEGRRRAAAVAAAADAAEARGQMPPAYVTGYAPQPERPPPPSAAQEGASPEGGAAAEGAAPSAYALRKAEVEGARGLAAVGLYADASHFYGGLDALVGPRDADTARGLRDEHVERADSPLFFDSSAHGLRTSALIEYWFVADPSPDRLAALGLHAWPRATLPRSPLPPAAFDGTVAAANQRLRALSLDTLTREQLVALRLYTGPMYVKYLAVLRGRGSNDAAAAAHLDILCVGNPFATTLHTISSGIARLARLTKVEKVYRTTAAGPLPPAFYERDAELRYCCGVELGCVSASLDYKGALAAAKRSDDRVLLELSMGFADRGAELGWLAQARNRRVTAV